jgi:hypothetical protein
MSTNLEEAIQKKVRLLADEQQEQVLEFVETLQRNHSQSVENKNGVDLSEHGISPELAAELRASLTTFEDWNDPEMDIYDSYDQSLASLNKKP